MAAYRDAGRRVLRLASTTTGQTPGPLDVSDLNTPPDGLRVMPALHARPIGFPNRRP